MTTRKHRLFIYDRKEMAVLVLLGVMVALFAFTLGIHLGKRVSPQQASQNLGHETTLAGTTIDTVPDSGEINEKAKDVPVALEDGLSQALHEEVARTGIKLDQSKQVDLPKNTKSTQGGATNGEDSASEVVSKKDAVTAHSKTEVEHGSDASPQAHEQAHEKATPEPSDVLEAKESTHPLPMKEAVKEEAHPRVHAHGKFTLQVGSYTTIQEARDRVAKLEADGLEVFGKQADLKGKGIWHRVYVGGFESKDEAEKSGMEWKRQKLIDSYVVTANHDASH